MSNVIWSPAQGIPAKQWTTGLSSYTQSNCQVTLTDYGLRIYRPANINPTDNGNVMWGGLRVVNSKTVGAHIYDNTVDNFFNLIQGHTYIIHFHVQGQSSNAFTNYGWSNNMGWGGGGLTPSPTNVSFHNIPSNFEGEQDCWYKFTINDTIVKTCTTAYSSFVANSQYLSYKDFAMGFGYSDTGSLGTDLYITNLRMYDITDGMQLSLNKRGQILPSEIIEFGNIAHINKGKNIVGGQIYEY